MVNLTYKLALIMFLKTLFLCNRCSKNITDTIFKRLTYRAKRCQFKNKLDLSTWKCIAIVAIFVSFQSGTEQFYLSIFKLFSESWYALFQLKQHVHVAYVTSIKQILNIKFYITSTITHYIYWVPLNQYHAVVSSCCYTEEINYTLIIEFIF